MLMKSERDGFWEEDEIEGIERMQETRPFTIYLRHLRASRGWRHDFYVVNQCVAVVGLARLDSKPATLAPRVQPLVFKVLEPVRKLRVTLCTNSNEGNAFLGHRILIASTETRLSSHVNDQVGYE